MKRTKVSKKWEEKYRPANKEMWEAEYRPAEFSDFAGNPLIECLPPFRFSAEIAERIRSKPKYSDTERNLPASIRMLALSRLNRYIEPLGQYFDAIDQLWLSIYQGYAYRNPLNQEHLKKQVEFYRRSLQGDLHPLVQGEPAYGPSFSLFGLSGVGKSTLIERALEFYPPVVLHRRYHLIQIVWLKLNCPIHGSLKQLLIDFLQKIDSLTENQFFSEIRWRNPAKDEYAVIVANIARIYHLGVLIIDEIQNLLDAKKDDQSAILNFLVRFNNESKIPIVVIGTPKANQLLKGPFREARRVGHHGAYIWTNIEDGPEFDYFLEGIWPYQWTKEKALLNKEMRDAFLEKTVGVPSVVVTLFQLTQWQAIRDGLDRITTELVSEVANNRFKLIAPMLQALKSGDSKMLEAHQDLYTEEMLKLARLKEQLFYNHDQTKKSERSKKHMRAVSFLISKGFDEENADKRVGNFFTANPDKTLDQAIKEIIETEDSQGYSISGPSLNEIVASGKKSGLSALESLKKEELVEYFLNK